MTRLDAALVARGLARSRGHARDLIEHGVVSVGGVIASKAAMSVLPIDEIVVDLGPHTDAEPPVLDVVWVSRAAGKLLGALRDLPGGGPVIAGTRAVDVGACTGGFTQVLLERGAAHVHAVDVGHGQLAAVLRSDPRVTELSGLNVRELTASQIDGPVDLAVVDLSFISLTLVLDRLRQVVRDGGDLLVLIKPQFEVGRRGLDGRGVVRSDRWRRDALRSVLTAGLTAGLDIRGVVRSRTPGQDGNTEYLAWLTRRPDAAGPSGADVGTAWDSVSEHIERVVAPTHLDNPDKAAEPTGGWRG